MNCFTVACPFKGGKQDFTELMTSLFPNKTKIGGEKKINYYNTETIICKFVNYF